MCGGARADKGEVQQRPFQQSSHAARSSRFGAHAIASLTPAPVMMSANVYKMVDPLTARTHPQCVYLGTDPPTWNVEPHIVPSKAVDIVRQLFLVHNFLVRLESGNSIAPHFNAQSLPPARAPTHVHPASLSFRRRHLRAGSACPRETRTSLENSDSRPLPTSQCTPTNTAGCKPGYVTCMYVGKLNS